MNVTIRQAKPEDWPIMQKLNQELFDDNAQYDETLDVNWPSSNAGAEYFQKAASDPAFGAFIAELDGTPVGYLAGTEKKFGYRNVKLAEIGDMGVTPEYRSQGVGVQLVDAFRKWAKENGFERVFVTAYAANEKAVAFYKKCGLAPIDLSLEGQV